MKKYNWFILITLVITLFILKFDIVYSALPLTGKIIVLDAGHGGLDPGTVHDKIYEKDINLDIVKELEKELIKLGSKVILTRDGDYDLSSPGSYFRKQSDFDNRITLINNSKADLYLSIHMNYLNLSKYGGTGVFYLKDEKIASIIQNNINRSFGFDREIKKIPNETYMYKKLKVNGVLIECGFLSNYQDRSHFQNDEYLYKYSKVIVESIVEYFRIKRQ